MGSLENKVEKIFQKKKHKLKYEKEVKCYRGFILKVNIQLTSLRMEKVGTLRRI